MPPAGSGAPSGRLREAFLAVRRERDELAVQLAQIEAYQPGIIDAARAWAARIDKASGGAASDSEWPERNEEGV